MSVFDNLNKIKTGGISGFKQVLASETKKVATKQRTGSSTGSRVPYMSNIQKIKTGGIAGFTQVLRQETGKVNITQGNVDVSKIMGNFWERYAGGGGGLLGAGWQTVNDFWSLLLGTGEQKADIISDLALGTENTPLQDTIQTGLEEEYGTGGILVNPLNPEDSKSFDLFGGIGKTLLIAAGVIGGLYLAGKYLGRSKK